jgi:hypothetical protein
MIIYPWFKKSADRPIRSIAGLPKTNTELKWYLPNTNPPSAKSNFTIWTQIHIATNEDPLMKITKHRESEMNWYYDQNGGGMYMKPLTDSDHPMYIGWMTFTGNFTGPKALTQMLKTSLASVCFTRPIGVKLKQQKGMKIADDMRNKHREKGSWFNQPWMSVQVETDTRNACIAKQHLYRLFNQKDKSQPFGLSYRFVPAQANSLLSTQGIEKMAKT